MQKILYSLTNPQKSIWFTEEFYKGTPIENITGSVIIPEKVNFSLLEQAINIFVEKNDSFRLKFIIEGQEVKQFVDSYSKFPIEIIDVSSNEDLQKVEQETASTVYVIFEDAMSMLDFTFVIIASSFLYMNDGVAQSP